MSSHARAHGLRREPGSVFADTCVLHKQGARGHASRRLLAHAASFVMFQCVTSHRCVLQMRADMCIRVLL